jgi:hypothetical protein
MIRNSNLAGVTYKVCMNGNHPAKTNKRGSETQTEDFVVEKILDSEKRGADTWYCIKWQGYPDTCN